MFHRMDPGTPQSPVGRRHTYITAPTPTSPPMAEVVHSVSFEKGEIQ